VDPQVIVVTVAAEWPNMGFLEVPKTLHVHEKITINKTVFS
jgi:hypothetical protein